MSSLYIYNRSEFKTPHEARESGALHRTSSSIHSSHDEVNEVVNTLCKCIGVERETLGVCYVSEELEFTTIEGETICEIF